MPEWLSILLGIVGAILASSGFWAFILAKSERRVNNKELADERRRNQNKLLLAIAHFRIYEQCRIALKNGYISSAELENITELYIPYHDCGGNGTGTKMYERVIKLPIKDD